ncbi:MAG TPA: NAD(P)/FAD-dependent oxidoreductase, partial [Chitinophagaceae bacterium]|nr:NAD(P)/FAD-dependent oxidoreductase [Chitinophagaceae bacterium]
MKKEVTIVGAGLVGSLLSIGFARRGYKVKVFERRPDMRKAKGEAGRSINLALSDRGLLALERVGMAEEIKKIAIPMHGRFIHNQDGTNAFQPYGKQGQFINSVSRSALNMKMMDLAEKEGIGIYFEQACTGIDWIQNKVTFGPRNVSSEFELLFAADGAFSAARLQYQLQHDKFNYAQEYIDCGYKELHIPPGTGGTFQLEKNALHIWPRTEYMLIALPNLDGSFTCTLFFPFEGPVSFASLHTEEKVNSFFKEVFPDTITLIPDLSKQFFNNPTSSLVTVRCYPWIDKDRFAMIGDAAHAIVPFFGQGMNCGFEDCRILDELIDTYKEDWEKILPAYQVLRKTDADAIAEMALNNFTEMREKT